MDSPIKITGTLIGKLLSGESVEIVNEWGFLHEKFGHNARDRVLAEVKKGDYEKVISVYFEKEIDDELYDSEEVYRIPYSENRRWLKTALKNAQNQWHTSFMNTH